MKPRLLIVLPDLAAGGAQPMNLRLARQLRLKGWEVNIAVLFDRPVAIKAEQLEELNIVQLRAKGLFEKARLPIRLARLAVHSDIVVGGMEFASTNYGYFSARLARKPFISWIHSSIHRHQYATTVLDRYICQWVYKRLQWVILPSYGALDSFCRVVGSPSNHATWQVIENFQDETSLNLNNPIPDCNACSKPVVVGVGRFVPVKCFDRLIRAHTELRVQGIDHHLVLLGDGPQRETLSQLVRQMGVEHSVFMPGHVQDVRPWLNHSTIFALCSDYEGFPLVIIEAMQAGLPIVSMDCPSGPREILDGGRFGMLVPDRDEVSFQRALAHLLTSPQQRNILSVLGKMRAKHYTADRIVPIWESLLHQVARH